MVISTTLVFGRVPRTVSCADGAGELLVRGDPAGQVLVLGGQLVVLAGQRLVVALQSASSGEEILVAPSTMPSASARKTAASETM